MPIRGVLISRTPPGPADHHTADHDPPKPGAVNSAQTLLWVLFATATAVLAPAFYEAQFAPGYVRPDPMEYFGWALAAAVPAAFAVLPIRLGRRSRFAWYAVLALCVAVTALIGYMLAYLFDPLARDSSDMELAAFWILDFVALPLVIVGCLLMPRARRWIHSSL